MYQIITVGKHDYDNKVIAEFKTLEEAKAAFDLATHSSWLYLIELCGNDVKTLEIK